MRAGSRQLSDFRRNWRWQPIIPTAECTATHSAPHRADSHFSRSTTPLPSPPLPSHSSPSKPSPRLSRQQHWGTLQSRGVPPAAQELHTVQDTFRKLSHRLTPTIPRDAAPFAQGPTAWGTGRLQGKVLIAALLQRPRCPRVPRVQGPSQLTAYDESRRLWPVQGCELFMLSHQLQANHESEFAAWSQSSWGCIAVCTALVFRRWGLLFMGKAIICKSALTEQWCPQAMVSL